MKIAETSTPHSSRPEFKIQALAAFLSIGILILVTSNGFFTYSGARLYINQPLYALLFAVAVQFAIAATLLALPYIRSFGKLVLILLYAAALSLSTISAFTYIYNTSLPEGADIHRIDTGLKASLSTELSDALKAEQQYVEAQRQALASQKRAAEEEAQRGYSSGRGPGKGPEYYRKMEQYEAEATRFQDTENHLQKAEAIYQQISNRLASADSDSSNARSELIVLLSRLMTHTNTETARNILTRASEVHLGTLHNPVDKAINALIDLRHTAPVTVIVSIIWAAIFDMLALFIGIIRYYLIKPRTTLLDKLYNGLLGFGSFTMKLGNVRSEARQQHLATIAAKQKPVNSAEMQSFATYLLAGSQLSLADQDDDPAEPIRTLTSYIEPLAIAKPRNAVGIPYETVREESRLKTLLAMLVQTEILINDMVNECYRLNPATEMAQKVLVFIRLGMKDQPEQLENVKFMLAAGS